MNKIICLIFITIFFTACNKEDDPIVFPKSIAEMNAERILSYKVDLVSVNSKHIPSEIQTTFISFTIEMPFFVVRHNNYIVNLPLENLKSITYKEENNTTFLSLIFE
ncbi:MULTISPECIES: hypothetical protein [unclassified Butyricimonas]|uniref:hypothetical protein n=1 Tax=unclassified Butyricimonas TaxID=2637652 RepID=UPI000B3AE494|nr:MULTISPECIES: hypothetical protein [unclassified Butyricimonas]MBS7197628.1 hypothetical protein [Bacteroidales bacterium]OUN66523.1 hypothetical protein B5G13_08815 [Butyricimonas sp. An62]